MAEYKAIRVEKGNGGFGGPLTIQGTEKKNKVMYITGGGIAPEILPKIVELSGLEPVNGFKTSAPEDELALVIIDCGGTLRCGLYPKKRIPTININPVGKAGPLAQFIKEDIYVSGVTNANIMPADGSEAPITDAAPAAEAPAEEKKGGIDTRHHQEAVRADGRVRQGQRPGKDRPWRRKGRRDLQPGGT